MEFIAANMAPLMFGSLVIFLLFGYPVAFALAANGVVFGLIGIELGLLTPALFQALPDLFRRKTASGAVQTKHDIETLRRNLETLFPQDVASQFSVQDNPELPPKQKFLLFINANVTAVKSALSVSMTSH